MFKEYRENNNLSQKDLSDLTNLDPRTIQRIENEEQLPNIITFAKFVINLNIKEKDIMNYLKKLSNLNNTKHNK